MFDRRHMEFMARFAGKHLSPDLTAKLIAEIEAVMPAFKIERFTMAVDKARPKAVKRPRLAKAA